MTSNDQPSHIKLDRADARIQEFVRSLPLDRAGSILELPGIPPLRVVPIVEELHDTDKLTTALLKRRRESQELNEDWADVDRRRLVRPLGRLRAHTMLKVDQSLNLVLDLP